MMEYQNVPIPFEEFHKGTGIDENCWIFQKKGEDAGFYRTDAKVYPDGTVEPTMYYFSNGLGTVYRFEYMVIYHETWMSKLDTTAPVPEWTIWSTFKVFD